MRRLELKVSLISGYVRARKTDFDLECCPSPISCFMSRQTDLDGKLSKTSLHFFYIGTNFIRTERLKMAENSSLKTIENRENDPKFEWNEEQIKNNLRTSRNIKNIELQQKLSGSYNEKVNTTCFTLGEGCIRKSCIVCTPRIQFLVFATDLLLRVWVT